MARRSRTGDETPTDTAGAVDEAADALYATDPDEFVARRIELARRARAAGDAIAAKRITGLRKPTVTAYIVNRFVLASPETVERLLDLNRRLRDAQGALDTETLRKLTEERRTTVGELARAALADAGRGPALRDEVVATLDAAVADPDIAGRLGRLLRAEHWSGFGVAAGDLPPDAPALRLVHGERRRRETTSRRRPAAAAAQTSRTGQRPAADRTPPAARRALREAEQAAAQAQAELAAAEHAARAARERVVQLTDELAGLQARLDGAEADRQRAKETLAVARAARRKADAALTRARRAGGG